MSGRPVVAVSLGDPYGIGPEVLAVALAAPRVRRACRLRVFGDRTVLALAARSRKVDLPSDLDLVEVTALANRKAFRFGRPGVGSGRAALAYLEAAVDAVQAGSASALCTGPIHKAQMVRAGFAHAGHTDFLRQRFGVDRVVMLLAGPTLRVALATVHVPLSEVSASLSVAGLRQTLKILDGALRIDFGIASPRIALTGVNPHAGEEGLLGTEELRILIPAIRQARAAGIDALGPYPADSLFARQVRTKAYDAILAMSHDQGLGPLKVLDFDRAVNLTLGLPRPRTSPDHGTAFDIAGKAVADPTSMIEALLLASKLAANRR